MRRRRRLRVRRHDGVLPVPEGLRGPRVQGARAAGAPPRLTSSGRRSVAGALSAVSRLAVRLPRRLHLEQRPRDVSLPPRLQRRRLRGACRVRRGPHAPTSSAQVVDARGGGRALAFHAPDNYFLEVGRAARSVRRRLTARGAQVAEASRIRVKEDQYTVGLWFNAQQVPEVRWRSLARSQRRRLTRAISPACRRR